MLMGEILVTKISTNPWETVKQSVVKMLSEVFSVSQDVVAGSIEKPPDSSLGDLASTIAFSLAKELKKSPVEVVNEVLSKLEALTDKEPMIDVNKSISFINRQGKTIAMKVRIAGTRGPKGAAATCTVLYLGKNQTIEVSKKNPEQKKDIGKVRIDLKLNTSYSYKDKISVRITRTDIRQGMHRNRKSSNDF